MVFLLLFGKKKPPVFDWFGACVHVCGAITKKKQKKNADEAIFLP